VPLGDSDGAQPSTTYGVVRMGRVGVGEVRYGSTTNISSSRGSNIASTSTPTTIASSSALSFSGMRRTTNAGMDVDFYHNPSRRRRQVRGLNNEVRTVDLGISQSSGLGAGGSCGLWWRWLREFGAFVAALWGVSKGMVLFLLERARGRVRVRDELAKGLNLSPGFDERLTVGRDGDGVLEEERELYQRFLRGEDISDDEDEVEEPTSSDEDEEDSVGDEQEGDDEEEGSVEAIKLFTDLLRDTGGHYDASISSSPMNSKHQSGEMVLAHLLHGSTGALPGPLTRRRWNALIRNEDHLGRRSRSYNQDEFEEDEEDEFF